MNKQEYTIRALKELPDKIKKNSAAILKYLRRLRDRNPGKLDERFRDVHDAVFEKYDCLSCAGCCRTTSPKFLDRDIVRISKYLSMHPKTFRLQYLKVDEDNDFVLNNIPCRFLENDNSCFIYPDRPKACADYPHTDSRNMRGLLMVTYRNTSICPAVYEIVNEIMKIFPL